MVGVVGGRVFGRRMGSSSCCCCLWNRSDEGRWLGAVLRGGGMEVAVRIGVRVGKDGGRWQVLGEEREARRCR